MKIFNNMDDFIEKLFIINDDYISFDDYILFNVEIIKINYIYNNNISIKFYDAKHEYEKKINIPKDKNIDNNMVCEKLRNYFLKSLNKDGNKNKWVNIDNLFFNINSIVCLEKQYYTNNINNNNDKYYFVIYFKNKIYDYFRSGNYNTLEERDNVINNLCNNIIECKDKTNKINNIEMRLKTRLNELEEKINTMLSLSPDVNNFESGELKEIKDNFDKLKKKN